MLSHCLFVYFSWIGVNWYIDFFVKDAFLIKNVFLDKKRSVRDQNISRFSRIICIAYNLKCILLETKKIWLSVSSCYSQPKNIQNFSATKK